MQKKSSLEAGLEDLVASSLRLHGTVGSTGGDLGGNLGLALGSWGLFCEDLNKSPGPQWPRRKPMRDNPYSKTLFVRVPLAFAGGPAPERAQGFEARRRTTTMIKKRRRAKTTRSDISS